MSDVPGKPDQPADPKQRRLKEYEDPHYHDEDEAAAPDDSEKKVPPPAARRRPLPRPRRRYEED